MTWFEFYYPCPASRLSIPPTGPGGGKFSRQSCPFLVWTGMGFSYSSCDCKYEFAMLFCVKMCLFSSSYLWSVSLAIVTWTTNTARAMKIYTLIIFESRVTLRVTLNICNGNSCLFPVSECRVVSDLDCCYEMDVAGIPFWLAKVKKQHTITWQFIPGWNLFFVLNPRWVNQAERKGNNCLPPFKQILYTAVLFFFIYLYLL